MTITNRLSAEKSPYLLQHAHNPVDWFPWGPEAFEKARTENKPIFLSIGYSTCHWCHVMERESFEDPTVADLLNEAFVCIKVDREERPDIDAIYMNVCVLMTGSGGWPLTIIMNPEQVPFFAATYIPKHSRHRRLGLLDLIPKISQIWRDSPESIEQAVSQVKHVVTKSAAQPSEAEVSPSVLAAAFADFAARFDSVHGGFSAAPKFPTPHNGGFLLRYFLRNRDGEALHMVDKTLTAMRAGGIYDHVGFGFHRYSTDAEWLVPHFEKMLYDQALLAIAYTEAYLVTAKPIYAQTVREIFTYVLATMTAPEGGFYSAEDADSEGTEGKFYLWTKDELCAVVGPADAELLCRVFGVTAMGNFHDEATGRTTGTNILHLVDEPTALARTMNLTEAALSSRIELARQKLYAEREQRVHPYKDDKILTDWNGLMISALARGATALNEPDYLAIAEKAMTFILTTMRTEQGLRHRYREGQAEILGQLDDYAFVVAALLDLYEATFEARYLAEAVTLTKVQLERFRNSETGIFYLTDARGEQLLVRPTKLDDAALPAGNSVALMNLLRLARITGDSSYEEKAQLLIASLSQQLTQYPSAFTHLLSALDFHFGPTFEVVVVGPKDRADTLELLDWLRRRFIPNMALIYLASDNPEPEILKVIPFIKEFRMIDERATVYVCKNQVCSLPTNDLQTLSTLLAR